jgi:hypothetical protein
MALKIVMRLANIRELFSFIMLNVVGHKRDWDRRKFGKALQATTFLLQVSFFQATPFLI